MEIKIRVKGFKGIDFDKRELKAAIRKGGAVVQKEARRLVARRAISGAGDFPGYDSGAMSRSIKVKVGSGGGYAVVMPFRTTEMGKDFYPPYLIYGTSRGLKKRKDFMQQALINKQAQIRLAIRLSIFRAIKGIG
jgi:hypothetical protein